MKFLLAYLGYAINVIEAINGGGREEVEKNFFAHLLKCIDKAIVNTYNNVSLHAYTLLWKER